MVGLLIIKLLRIYFKIFKINPILASGFVNFRVHKAENSDLPKILYKIILKFYVFLKKISSFAPHLKGSIILSNSADVAKLADAPDLGSGAARHRGSSPSPALLTPLILTGALPRSRETNTQELLFSG